MVGDGGEIEPESSLPPEETTTAPQTTARHLLVDWANKQDGWIRSVVDAVLSSSGEISENTLDSVYQRYLAEKGLSDATVDPVEALTIGEAMVATKSPLSIDRLSEVRGVNALAPDQEIEFNPNLTVVFGENGSGKTGYTRILKALADVRTMEEILGDVNENGKQVEQRCTIHFTADSSPDEYEWKGETGVVPFTAISVFDSPAVSLHVDSDLSYLYTPGDLALFPMVGNGIERVHTRLTGAIDETKPKQNPFLSHFANGTSAYTLIETLGPASDLDALKALAKTKEAADAELKTLGATVDALRAGAVSAQVEIARTRRELYAKLSEIAKAVETFQAEVYLAAVAELAAAKDAERELRDKLASAGGAGGEAAESWQRFILAGEAYRAHIEGVDGHSQDECIYCRQPLGDDARALLDSYRQFATAAVRERLEAAERQSALLVKGIVGLDLRGIEDGLAAAREGQEEDVWLTEAAEFLEALELAIVPLRDGLSPGWGELPNRAPAIREESESRLATAADLINTLAGKETDRAADLKKAETERRELTDRVELSSRLAAISEHVEAAKWAQRAEELSGRFRSISTSLTATVKTASGALLNSDFEARFKEECAALRAPEVGLAFPGRRGEAARRKTVSADHKPSKVLSEGEQKVIALADFLAEASLRQVPAPLIFDDPVNSLDYRRIGEVSSRIALLAADRQVIIFTHNLWLAVELLAKFESNRERCTYYRVSDEGGKGLITKGVHPRWDTVKKTKAKINSAIQEAEALQGEQREVFVERTYSLMRSWCEVVVEEELFAGVLGRFAPNVSMTKLDQVRTDRLPAAIATIKPIFEKACRIMEGHSQPLESLGVTPSLEDAKKDWAKLQTARDAYLD